MSDLPCPRHPDRMAAPGLVVCSSRCDRPEHGRCEGHGCEQQLARALRRIATLWPDLADQHFATTNVSHINRVHGSRPPCNLDVVEAMDTEGRTHGETPIAHVVTTWCRVVVEDRRLVAPVETASQAQWLITQVPWLCAQDFADEVIDELRECARSLAGLLGDREQGQWVHCPTEGCRGTMRVDLGQRWVEHNVDPLVWCKMCGRSTSAGMLLRMAQSGELEGWADADVMTLAYGVSRSTLDRWAQSGRIDRDHGRFRLDQVAAARDARVARGGT